MSIGVFCAGHRLRGELMAGVAAMGLVVCGGTAQAQNAGSPPAPSADPVAADATDIIVTGYRASIEESLRQKRNAGAIINVITADDIGKFPDKNVADALQRVPGVVINRNGGVKASSSAFGGSPRP